ncbi:winged helix-turn-helix transcriptional regulator [Sphingomonas sinipercae]|uniref:Winged helix-turn-helix transcriptional regulator n=1 Tax=Sphingomonas sinipercae TaxID=2714944 RepID=A0A6G7ZQJ1_9SPHN|nr:winged helix-turn-helix domain-containing protein [Sphingomonas sinipercae]QIL03198.1 winged helix-turn-helix transcriptional regulator [Sphingomonas sinipercae]
MRKTAQDQSSERVVSDPALARLFADEAKRRILLAFAPEPRSVTAVAATLERPVGYVFYHVQRLLERGLLYVAREDRRQGKPVKYYRTTAASFFLPSGAMEQLFTSDLASELRSLLEHNFYKSDLAGVRVSATADGAPEIQLVPRKANQPPSAGELWAVLRLDTATVRALGQELGELFARYEALEGDGPEYLVHAAFAKRSS